MLKSIQTLHMYDVYRDERKFGDIDNYFITREQTSKQASKKVITVPLQAVKIRNRTKMIKPSKTIS